MHMKNDLARDSSTVFCVIFVMYVWLYMYVKINVLHVYNYTVSYCSQNVNVKFPNEVHSYRLTGVVTYAKAGNAPHYMAFVRSIKDTNQWFAANDSQVNNNFNLHM